MAKVRVKFGKSEATKAEVTVETKRYFGQGATKEAALLDALTMAQDHEDWQTKRINEKDATIKSLQGKLAFIHRESGD
jgi:hypothetical protein